MASTNYYTVNIHSYRFCVSYIDFSVSRVGPTRTAYSIFHFKFILIQSHRIIYQYFSKAINKEQTQTDYGFNPTNYGVYGSNYQ